MLLFIAATKKTIKYIKNNLKYFSFSFLMTPFQISDKLSDKLHVCQFGSPGVLEPRSRYPSGQELTQSIWRVTLCPVCQRHSKGAIEKRLPKASFELESTTEPEGFAVQGK